MNLEDIYYIKDKEERLGFFRLFQIYQQEDTTYLLTPEHLPLWMDFIRRSYFECLDDILQTQLYLNLKDKRGNGWLHYCNTYQVPPTTTIKGLSLLDQTWWIPNHDGVSPFEQLPHVDVAQRMAMRWWADRIEKQDISVRRFQLLIQQAEQSHRLDLVRVWKFWMPKQ